jgi:hypothetical protein
MPEYTRRKSTLLFLFLAATFVLVPCLAAHAADADEFFPSEPDPFSGMWKGRWSEEEDVDPDISAQVIALGRDRYEIRLGAKLFMRCPPIAIIEAERKGDRLPFSGAGIRGEIRGDRITGKRMRTTFEMKRYEHEPPTLGASPPEGAIVLFDGSSFDAWESPKGWELLDGGVMMVTPDGGDLVSKQHFRDVRLHVEFRLPFMPRARKQQRGNSGVFVQGEYECQVLDSFGLEGYYNECGALYKVSAPKVNACLPPLAWQTYDIEYHGARFGADGKVSEYPRMNVFHNGILIQKDQELPWITAWKEKDRLKPPPEHPGPIKLQAHNNYVQYRNIWLVDLGN